MNGVEEEAEQRGEELPAQGDVQTEEEPPSKKTRTRSKRRCHICPVCSRAFTRPYRLAAHMCTHSGDKPHSCSVCGKCFAEKKTLTVHQRVHTGEKPHTCPVCGVSFAQRSCLRRHKLGHAAEKPHRCSVCGRGFIQRRHLVQHERTHTGERPFGCSLCPKRFASSSGLTEHQKTHAETSPHSCPVCEKNFSTPASLRDHVRLHTGEKPHRCSLCSKSFNRPGLLKKHLQKHAAEKAAAAAGKEEAPHRCFLCRKDFSSAEELQQHLRLHQRGLAFVCDICDRSFSKASRLREHIRCHTGEKPFQCGVCKKQFSRQRVLTRHLEIHNREGRNVAPAAASADASAPATTAATDAPDPATPDNSSTLSDADNKKADEPLKDGSPNGLQVENRNDEEEAVHSLTDGGPGSVKKLYICSFCGKSLSRPYRLKEHMKMHTAEELQRCSVCGKSFSTTTNLKAHEKTHLANKPHPCSICPRSFLWPSQLRRHMRVHIRDGLIADPADKELWLNMKTEEEEDEEEEEEEEEKNEEEEVHSCSRNKQPPEVWISERVSNEKYGVMHGGGGGGGECQCKDCGFHLKNTSVLQKCTHRITESPPSNCKHCNLSLKAKGSLVKHLRSEARGKETCCYPDGNDEGVCGERSLHPDKQKDSDYSDLGKSRPDEDDNGRDKDGRRDEDNRSKAAESSHTASSDSEKPESSQSIPLPPKDSTQKSSASARRALFARRRFDASTSASSGGSRSPGTQPVVPQREPSPPRSPPPGPHSPSSCHVSPSALRPVSPVRSLSPIIVQSHGLEFSGPPGCLADTSAPCRGCLHPRGRQSTARLSVDEFGLSHIPTHPARPRRALNVLSHLPLHSQGASRSPSLLIPIGGIHMIQPRSTLPLYSLVSSPVAATASLAGTSWRLRDAPKGRFPPLQRHDTLEEPWQHGQASPQGGMSGSGRSDALLHRNRPSPGTETRHLAVDTDAHVTERCVYPETTQGQKKAPSSQTQH